jgi:hypothetical protein
MNDSEILGLLLDLGAAMIRSGAETHRVGQPVPALLGVPLHAGERMGRAEQHSGDRDRSRRRGAHAGAPRAAGGRGFRRARPAERRVVLAVACFAIVLGFMAVEAVNRLHRKA